MYTAIKMVMITVVKSLVKMGQSKKKCTQNTFNMVTIVTVETLGKNVNK